jgi:hypothetical protein
MDKSAAPDESLRVSKKGRYLVVGLAVVYFLVNFLLSPTATFASGGYLPIALAVLLLLSVIISPLGVSTNGRYLLVALALFQLWIQLLNPHGFENRLVPSGSAFLAWAVWRLGVGTPGIFLSLASLVVLCLRPRSTRVTILAIVGALLLESVFLADQAGLVGWAAPPAAITVVEVIASVTVLVILYLASRVYRENKVKTPPATTVSSTQA